VILRRHRAGGTRSFAIFSDCGRYRYILQRRWAAGPAVVFVMLNPSTADETRNDPTIERCERRARAMGLAGVRIVNLCAFRAVRPADLWHAADPEGPANAGHVLRACHGAGMVICAWGVHGARVGRGERMRTALAEGSLDLWHLGLTKGGQPRHPLYVGYRVQPTRWAAGD
jgi:hypothetical protein